MQVPAWFIASFVEGSLESLSGPMEQSEALDFCRIASHRDGYDCAMHINDLRDEPSAAALIANFVISHIS